jgi:hypothetical protein
VIKCGRENRRRSLVTVWQTQPNDHQHRMPELHDPLRTPLLISGMRSKFSNQGVTE